MPTLRDEDQIISIRTGSYKMGARYYDQNRGNFTQVDPMMGKLATPITLNPYQYAGDDPINTADPTGMFLDDVIGGIGNALDLVNPGQCALEEGMTCYGAITLGVTMGAIVSTACVGITGGTGLLAGGGCAFAGLAAGEITYRATMEEYG